MPFNPAYASPAYGYAGSSYGMSPYGGYGTTVFGLDPAAGTEKTFMQKSKDFLNEKTGPLPNYGWLLAAAAAGSLWYYSSKRR